MKTVDEIAAALEAVRALSQAAQESGATWPVRRELLEASAHLIRAKSLAARVPTERQTD